LCVRVQHGQLCFCCLRRHPAAACVDDMRGRGNGRAGVMARACIELHGWCEPGRRSAPPSLLRACLCPCGRAQAMTSKDGKASRQDQVKQLLAQYGSAYLITSISFALVSFGLCYAAVNAGAARGASAEHAHIHQGPGRPDRGCALVHGWHTHVPGAPRHTPLLPSLPVPMPAGVDVASLISQVGLQATDTSEKVGTFAIAYAAHKALSPVRFPPTVALTPLVAKYIGSKKAEGSPPPADGQ
jgi:hypothetical protein